MREETIATHSRLKVTAVCATGMFAHLLRQCTDRPLTGTRSSIAAAATHAWSEEVFIRRRDVVPSMPQFDGEFDGAA